MTPYDRQKAEIETIKPRSFTLELSDADVKRLYEKAYSNGITPAQLLQDYIGDLLDGTYTRGSDERMYAQQYFDRCIYTWPDDPRSFLQWALEEYRIDDIADELETLDYATGDIKYYEEHPDDPDNTPDFINKLQGYISEAESELQEIYSEYAAGKDKPQPLDEGIAAIRRYMDELQSMTERGNISQ
jgi:hypothetical protein